MGFHGVVDDMACDLMTPLAVSSGWKGSGLTMSYSSWGRSESWARLDWAIFAILQPGRSFECLGRFRLTGDKKRKEKRREVQAGGVLHLYPPLKATFISRLKLFLPLY